MDAATVTTSGGPVTLHAEIGAKALLPGMEEPFELGEAELTATWPDVTNLLDVNVSLTGVLQSLMKLRPIELLEVLNKVKELTTTFDSVIPVELQQGLDKVISVVKSFDDLITSTLTDPVSGTIVSFSLQDVIHRFSIALNEELEGFGLHLDGTVLSWDFALDPDMLASLSVSAPSASVTLSDLHFT